MAISTRSGLLAFLLALAAVGTPAGATGSPAPAATSTSSGIEAGASIESRLSRIARALQEREQALPEQERAGTDLPLAYGFVNRPGPGGWVKGAYGGAFSNVHPYYGGGRFVNGGGGFVNGHGGGFANAPYRGGMFRNW
jgi:rSAM-associated Gly-rich repeat protein